MAWCHDEVSVLCALPVCRCTSVLSTRYPARLLGPACMDCIAAAQCGGVQTAADLFERLHRPALRVLPLPCPPLGAGECLEILGEPGVGKSAVTAACAAGCVLPIAFGGCGARALLLDTADGFDFETLRHELHARIAAARRAEGAHAHANAGGHAHAQEQAHKLAHANANAGDDATDRQESTRAYQVAVWRTVGVGRACRELRECGAARVLWRI
eukprot:2163571-Pleurochrysis_carterae.AAC.1